MTAIGAWTNLNSDNIAYMGEYQIGEEFGEYEKNYFVDIFFTLPSKDTFWVHHTVIFETRSPCKQNLRSGIVEWVRRNVNSVTIV